MSELTELRRKYLDLQSQRERDLKKMAELHEENRKLNKQLSEYKEECRWRDASEYKQELAQDRAEADIFARQKQLEDLAEERKDLKHQLLAERRNKVRYLLF